MLGSPFADLDAFTAALGRAEVDTKVLVLDDKGTICATAREAARAAAATNLVAVNNEITVKGPLSRGGMGRILLAQQSSLGREVAVKVASDGDEGSLAQADLVVEARVAGQLEHPNIVPVHLLGVADGKPVIVMKRIEGRTWKGLLTDKRDQAPPLPPLADRPDGVSGRDLRRDIEILMEVCQALHFAHDRGVVHRDVKPQNVMVGRFGEVYLLDWGIAVGFGDAPPAELPLAKDVDGVAGTPAYMAPEMALPAGAISPRTDVYLAGAVLYEVITGSPPHAGRNLEESLFSAHIAAVPSFADDVPEELADICRRAMSRDPADRFASAEALRLALAAFSSHAASRETCRAAEESLQSLQALPADAADGDVQRLFNECRFGFSLALRTWPESTRARDGLARAVAGMARRELDAGRYDSARLLAAELAVVPPELEERLAALRQRRDHEAVELSRLTHETDVSVAERERAVVVVICAAGWFAMLLAMDLLARFGVWRAQSGTFAIIMGAFLLLVGGVGLVVPGIRATAASRSLYLALLITVAGIDALHVIGWLFALPPTPMLAIGHTLLAACLLTVAAQDPRMLAGAALSAAIPIVIVVAPPLTYLGSGIGALVALALVARGWSRPRRDPERGDQ